MNTLQSLYINLCKKIIFRVRGGGKSYVEASNVNEQKQRFGRLHINHYVFLFIYRMFLSFEASMFFFLLWIDL